VLAEITGLIEGAHTGKGLGHEFLRHAMRTRVLIHLIDGGSPTPVEDMIHVNNELALWDASLAKRPQVVAVNKIDLPDVKARELDIKRAFAEAGVSPVFISASERIGLDDLVKETWALLKASDIRSKATVQPVTKVFRPQPVDGFSAVRKKGNTFIISDPDLERLLDKTDLSNPEEQSEFREGLEKLGINKLLKSAGARTGDKVITGNKEWNWSYSDEHRHHGRNV
jgi:GTP-binding protein